MPSPLVTLWEGQSALAKDKEAKAPAGLLWPEGQAVATSTSDRRGSWGCGGEQGLRPGWAEALPSECALAPTCSGSMRMPVTCWPLPEPPPGLLLTDLPPDSRAWGPGPACPLPCQTPGLPSRAEVPPGSCGCHLSSARSEAGHLYPLSSFLMSVQINAAGSKYSHRCQKSPSGQ